MHAFSSASSWASSCKPDSKAATLQRPAPRAPAAPTIHGLDSELITASRRPSRRKSGREECFRAGQTTGDHPLTLPPNLAIMRGANERCVPPSNVHHGLPCWPGAVRPVCPNNAGTNQHRPPLLRSTRPAVAHHARGKTCAATALAAVGSSTGRRVGAVNADGDHLPFRARDGHKLCSYSPDLGSGGKFGRLSAVTSFRPSASALVAVGGSAGEVRAVNADGEELPFRIVDGRKFYLDELDVAGLLDGQSYLRPFDPSTYDAAAFLWKKIGDIPKERRHRLLDLLLPRHIQAMWEVAGTRYEDDVEDGEVTAPATAAVLDAGPATTTAATAAAATAAAMLPCAGRSIALKAELWNGLVTGLPQGLGWLARFQKAFFLGADGLRYGRVTSGGPLFTGLSNIITPLYFRVLDATSTPVVATGDAAEVCFDYGDGQLHLAQPGCLPPGFPTPRPHPPLFDDDMRDYVRAAGPGVLVGQTWQEGRRLDSVPKRFLGEFILIRSSA